MLKTTTPAGLRPPSLRAPRPGPDVVTPKGEAAAPSTDVAAPKADVARPSPTAEADAFDGKQARNPYETRHVAEADRARYDRPNLAALNPLGARIASLQGAATPRVDADAYLGAVAAHPHLEGPIGTTKNGDVIPSVSGLFPPLGDPRKARAEAVRALSSFSVMRADGTGHTNLLARIEAARLPPDAMERVLDAFTRFHDSITHHRPFDQASSDVNWKHICAEAAQVLDACQSRKLPADKTEDALLASLFSDAAKFPSTLLTHNVDGALAAFHVLKERFDLRDPDEAARLAGILAATKEHQIGPPSFMAMIAGFQVTAALKAAGEDPKAHTDALGGIRQKLADPLNPAWVKQDASGGGQIAFTDDEKALLARIGLHEWAVPHPKSPHFDASMAVICGDSLVNYAMPDGVGKIVDISGPGTLFQDPTVFHSMFSCGQSYVDAERVVGRDLLPLYQAGAAYTRRAVDEVESWLLRQLATGFLPLSRQDLERAVAHQGLDVTKLDVVREVHAGGDQVFVKVPTPDDVAFVHRPLDYAAGGADLELAKLIKQTVADLLRDHAHWMPEAQGPGAGAPRGDR